MLEINGLIEFNKNLYHNPNYEELMIQLKNTRIEYRQVLKNKKGNKFFFFKEIRK